MSNEVALPSQFKDVIRERILSAFMDLIPKEKIDELVELEIKAFFETDQLLTVTQTTIEVDNPKYEAGSYGYGNDKRIKRDAMVLGSKMTPFRQMVWATLHTALAPQLLAIINDEGSELRVSLQEWLTEKAKPDLNVANKDLFNTMAMGMVAMLLRNCVMDAASSAHMTMTSAFQNAGLNMNNMPGMFVPPAR